MKTKITTADLSQIYQLVSTAARKTRERYSTVWIEIQLAKKFPHLSDEQRNAAKMQAEDSLIAEGILSL